MYESHQNLVTDLPESYYLSDGEPPEAPDNWALEDFEDILPCSGERQ